MEQQIQDLSTRVGTTLTTTGKAENVAAGFLTALRVFGLTSSPHATGENSQAGSVHPAGGFSALIAALDRLAGASARQVRPDLVTPSPKTLSPHQLTQIAALQKGSEHNAG